MRRGEDALCFLIPPYLVLSPTQPLAGAPPPLVDAVSPVPLAKAPRGPPSRVRRRACSLSVQNPSRAEPGRPSLANAGKPAAAHRRAAPPPAASSAAQTHQSHSQPSDPDRTVPIRSDPRSTQPVPVNRGTFKKETLGFMQINPRSMLGEKNLQTSPLFYVLNPELF